jgi:hypothetical protein
MRLIGLVLALSFTLAPLAAEAQPATRTIPRLCFLTFDPGTAQDNRFNSFFQGLRNLGYVDGQTITTHYLSADGQGERRARASSKHAVEYSPSALPLLVRLWPIGAQADPKDCASGWIVLDEQATAVGLDDGTADR